jgi:hypothetical protein
MWFLADSTCPACAYQEVTVTTATAPRKRRNLSFMGARKKSLFASVLCSGLLSVVVACHRDRSESFYASLADVRKADIAQSWIPDDLLPASSGTVHVVGELSPSKGGYVHILGLLPAFNLLGFRKRKPRAANFRMQPHATAIANPLSERASFQLRWF